MRQLAFLQPNASRNGAFFSNSRSFEWKLVVLFWMHVTKTIRLFALGSLKLLGTRKDLPRSADPFGTGPACVTM